MDFLVAYFNVCGCVVIEKENLTGYSVIFFDELSLETVQSNSGICLDLVLQSLAGQVAAHIFFHHHKELRIVFKRGEILALVKSSIGLQGFILHQLLGRIVLHLGEDIAFLHFDLVLLDLLVPQDLIHQFLPGLTFQRSSGILIQRLVWIHFTITGIHFLDLILIHFQGDLGAIHFPQIGLWREDLHDTNGAHAKDEDDGHEINDDLLFLSQVFKHYILHFGSIYYTQENHFSGLGFLYKVFFYL